MDKSLLVPKTVNWTDKPKEKDPLTRDEFLTLTSELLHHESLRTAFWQKQIKEYADALDQRIRDSFK